MEAYLWPTFLMVFSFMKRLEVFRGILKGARSIIALTGAGVSAESGVPTFRGEGGFWRTYRATDLATPHAFRRDPVLVWQFYHYRRELVFTKVSSTFSSSFKLLFSHETLLKIFAVRTG